MGATMWEWIKHRRELKSYDLWEAKERKAFDEKVKAARAAGEDIPDEGQWAALYFMINDERDDYKTRWLLRMARKHGVPTPSHSKEGAWNDAMGRRTLTDEAAATLESEIIKMANESWHYWELRLKVIAGFVALLGAVIGLAIFK